MQWAELSTENTAPYCPVYNVRLKLCRTVSMKNQRRRRQKISLNNDLVRCRLLKCPLGASHWEDDETVDWRRTVRQWTEGGQWADGCRFWSRTFWLCFSRSPTWSRDRDLVISGKFIFVICPRKCRLRPRWFFFSSNRSNNRQTVGLNKRRLLLARWQTTAWQLVNWEQFHGCSMVLFSSLMGF